MDDEFRCLGKTPGYARYSGYDTLEMEAEFLPVLGPQLFADASSVQAPLRCMVEAEIVPATGNPCLNRRPPLGAGPSREVRHRRSRCEASRCRKEPDR